MKKINTIKILAMSITLTAVTGVFGQGIYGYGYGTPQSKTQSSSGSSTDLQTKKETTINPLSNPAIQQAQKIMGAGDGSGGSPITQSITKMSNKLSSQLTAIQTALKNSSGSSELKPIKQLLINALKAHYFLQFQQTPGGPDNGYFITTYNYAQGLSTQQMQNESDNFAADNTLKLLKQFSSAINPTAIGLLLGTVTYSAKSDAKGAGKRAEYNKKFKECETKEVSDGKGKGGLRKPKPADVSKCQNNLQKPNEDQCTKEITNKDGSTHTPTPTEIKDCRKKKAKKDQDAKNTAEAKEARTIATNPTKELRELAIDITGPDQLKVPGADKTVTSADSSMSYTTLMNNPNSAAPTDDPGIYAYNDIAATNYIKLILNNYGFNHAWFGNDAIGLIFTGIANLNKESQNKKDDLAKQFIEQLQDDPQYLSYKTKYRSALAAHSLIATTFYNLMQERSCGQAGCDSQPSALLISSKMNNWRLHRKTWYQFIKSASGTSLLREIALMQAQSLANQYQQHIDNENTEALLALINQQLSSQSGQMNMSAVNDLKKSVQTILKAVNPQKEDDKKDE